jgi:hypothetical protein
MEPAALIGDFLLHSGGARKARYPPLHGVTRRSSPTYASPSGSLVEGTQLLERNVMQKTGKDVFLGVMAALSLIALSSAASAQAGMVRELDANGDGTITKAEAQSGFETQFKRMDANHDGVLSEDEFVNARLAVLQKLDSDGDGQITRSELRADFMAHRRGR